MHKIQILAGMLANLFTKNPEIEQKEEILQALTGVETELTANAPAAAPVAALKTEATAPVVAPTTAPVAEVSEPVAVAPTVDIAALTAQVTQAVMATPEIVALKEKAAKWDTHQAAIGNAGTPSSDAGAPPTSTPGEMTMAQIQAIHKYAFD